MSRVKGQSTLLIEEFLSSQASNGNHTDTESNLRGSRSSKTLSGYQFPLYERRERKSVEKRRRKPRSGIPSSANASSASLAGVSSEENGEAVSWSRRSDAFMTPQDRPNFLDAGKSRVKCMKKTQAKYKTVLDPSRSQWLLFVFAILAGSCTAVFKFENVLIGAHVLCGFIVGWAHFQKDAKAMVGLPLLLLSVIWLFEPDSLCMIIIVQVLIAVTYARYTGAKGRAPGIYALSKSEVKRLILIYTGSVCIGYLYRNQHTHIMVLLAIGLLRLLFKPEWLTDAFFYLLSTLRWSMEQTITFCSKIMLFIWSYCKRVGYFFYNLLTYILFLVGLVAAVACFLYLLFLASPHIWSVTAHSCVMGTSLVQSQWEKYTMKKVPDESRAIVIPVSQDIVLSAKSSVLDTDQHASIFESSGTIDHEIASPDPIVDCVDDTCHEDSIELDATPFILNDV